MLRAEHAEWLEQLPPGAVLWIGGLGRSLAPLLRSGDGVKVRRCAKDDVRPGDIAVVRRDGGLMAHLVDSVAPLSTSSFLGRRDPEGGELLGLVIAVRRSGVLLPLPAGSRHLLRFLHRGAAAGWRVGAVRSTVRGLLELATSPITARLRSQLLGPVRVERLVPGDLEALLIFGGDHLAIPASFLERQLLRRWQAEGVALGAFNPKRRMVGFAFLDDYRQEGLELEGWWIRALVVAPGARGLGIAGRLVAHLCEHARTAGLSSVFADIREDNERSRRLFARLGFVRIVASREALARCVIEQAHPGSRWIVMEKRIVPA